MPLQLTVPFDTGAADDVDYTHAKITQFGFDPDEGIIYAVVRLGTINGSTFVTGKIKSPATFKNLQITGADYTNLVAKQTSAQGVLIYNEVARELYQYLIDKGYYAGTIV